MKSIRKKLTSCLVALALSVGLMPMAAFATQDLDSQVTAGGISRVTADGGSASTSVGIIVGDGFTVADPQESMFEEGYLRGDAIAVWGKGGVAPYTATWEYAVAAYDSAGNPLYTSALRMPAGGTSGDEQIVDDETGAIEFTHIPNGNENLTLGGTYWYWLTVTDANGNKATQAVDKPYLVVRESAYRPGPFTDNAAASGWTWAIAGAGAQLNGIGAGAVTNNATGAIHNGITLSSSTVSDTGVKNLMSETAQPMLIEGDVWTVAITEGGLPEGTDAYKGSILVMLDASEVEMPSVGAGATPVPGVDFEIIRLSADGKSASALPSSSVRYENGFISFTVSDSAATGLIGTYAIAVKQKDDDADKSFTVETACDPAIAGTVSSGGTFAYRQQPVMIFTAASGYVVDSITLSIKPSKDAAGSPRVVEIPHASTADANAPYGTWSGNSYTFPETFNQKGDEGYALLTVHLVEDPNYTDPDPLTLSVTVEGEGAVYVGVASDATRVTDTKAFTSGVSYGSYELVVNEAVPLIFEPATGSVLKSLTVNGAPILDAADGYTISKFNQDITVHAVFEHGLPDPGITYQVSADYDDAVARVGFGAQGTQWIDTATVAQGASTTMVIEPKTGYELIRAIKFNGGSTQGEDVTAACATGALVISDVQSDVRVRFEFAEIELSVRIPEAPFGGSITGIDGEEVVGTHTVTVSRPVQVVITAEAGYQLEAGTLKLGDIVLQPSSAKENADGTTDYYVDIAYPDVMNAGSGASLSFAFEKQSDSDRGRYTIVATAGEHGSVAAATLVDAGADVTIDLFPDAGYRVAYVSVDGKRITGAGASVSNGVECDIKCATPYITFMDVQENYRLHVEFEPIDAVDGENPGAEIPDTPIPIKPVQPGESEDGDGPGGSILPGQMTDGSDDILVYPGGDQVFTFVPEDGTWVLDTVSIDGVELLDRLGKQLKDKLGQTDADGLLYDPDIPLRYDPATGEYVHIAANGAEERIVLDLDAGTLTVRNVQEAHEVGATFARVGTVTIDVMASTNGNECGAVIPRGTFGWKKKLPLVIVATPEEGAALVSASLTSDGVVRDITDDLVDATADHLKQAVEAQTMAYEQTQYGYKPVSIAGSSRAMPVAAAETVPDGAKAYVLPEGFLEPGKTYTVHAAFAQAYTVKAKVEGGHGSIANAQAGDEWVVSHVAAGDDLTISFTPDAGYRVKSVTDNGQAVSSYTETSYTLSDISADHEVVVTFEAYASGPAAGASDPASRALRRMTSLASTGDLAAPGILALAGVACAAAGIAVILAGRRRRQGDWADGGQEDAASA